MELEQLRVFCAAAERRSFSAAAAELYISHSTVSRAVAELEGRCFSTPWPDSALRYAMEGEGCTLLAAETEEGALAGYLALQCVLDEGYINNVCTSPEQRRRGVGSALLEETLRRARELFGFPVSGG